MVIGMIFNRTQQKFKFQHVTVMEQLHSCHCMRSISSTVQKSVT